MEEYQLFPMLLSPVACMYLLLLELGQRHDGGGEVYDVLEPYKHVVQISLPNLQLMMVFCCVTGQTWLRCMVKA